MIEKFSDMALEEAETIEAVEIIIKEKLGVSFQQLKEALSVSVQERAQELSLEFANVAPHGDYSKIIEDNDGMAEFFRSEAHKPENWEITEVRPVDQKGMPNLITFGFSNKAVDDGSSMTGFVYVNFEGKIKHAFAQGDDN